MNATRAHPPSSPLPFLGYLILALGLLGATPLAASPPAEPTPHRIVSTLQMDPESPREILGWWIAEDELVHVAPDGRFRRWTSHDRLSRPDEIGRWHRENHAVFWLEAYTVPKVPRRRAALWLKNDALMATLSGIRPAFKHAERPPAIPADDLLGTWIGPGGRLEFREDSTYAWTAPATDAGPAASLGGQRGRWHLDGEGRLRLEPLVAAQPLVLVSLVRDEGETPAADDDRVAIIHSIAGPMRRPAPDPGPPGIEPMNPGTTGTEVPASRGD